MTRRVTVLKLNRPHGTRGPFEGHGFAMAAVAAPLAEPPSPEVQVHDLTPRDMHDLARDPDVAALAPVMPIKLLAPVEATAAPAAIENAWGVAAVGAEASPFDGSGVPVAILDTGIDANHVAFAGVELVQNDFTGSGNGDANGHGTHCAGTVFGRDVNGTRIGVARGISKAFIGKIIGNDGGGESDWLFNALRWAIESGARVISMSLGFDFTAMVVRAEATGMPTAPATSRALEAYRGNLRMFDALMQLARARAAFDGGAVIVAAAGNESARERTPAYEIGVSLPAAAEGVIAVGALTRKSGGLAVAPFSNTLPQLCAPGVDILSAARNGGLRQESGTSMATPHVAGVAALWWQSLRAQGITSASVVTSKLLANARTDVLASGQDVADRGVGVVAAPRD